MAAVENTHHRLAILELLFDHQRDEILQWEIIDAMITFILNHEESRAILNRYKDTMPVTEDIIKAISCHPVCYGSTKIMKLLLDQRGDVITITEEIANLR